MEKRKGVGKFICGDSGETSGVPRSSEFYEERSSRYYSRCGPCGPTKSTNRRTERCYTLPLTNTASS